MNISDSYLPFNVAFFGTSFPGLTHTVLTVSPSFIASQRSTRFFNLPFLNFEYVHYSHRALLTTLFLIACQENPNWRPSSVCDHKDVSRYPFHAMHLLYVLSLWVSEWASATGSAALLACVCVLVFVALRGPSRFQLSLRLCVRPDQGAVFPASTAASWAAAPAGVKARINSAGPARGCGSGWWCVWGSGTLGKKTDRERDVWSR